MNNTNNTLRDFRTVDLNLIPPLYTYPRQYWFLQVPGKQIRYLLDDNRLDDAVLYFIFAIGASFPEEIPFLHSRPDCAEIVARLRRDGRVKLFNEGVRHHYRTTELVLGPKSDIESIREDVEFLFEPPSFRLNETAVFFNDYMV